MEFVRCRSEVGLDVYSWFGVGGYAEERSAGKVGSVREEGKVLVFG